MWFKKKKNDSEVKNNVEKDDSMSKMIDEVLNEKAAEKEAAMRESAESAESAAAGEGAPSGTLPQTLLVPMTPVEGSENKETKTMQFRPAVVKNSEGELMFPAFSEKAQIPDDYGKRYKTVAMPLAAACGLAAKIPECMGIVVNPFTKPMILNKDSVENVAKAVAEQNAQTTVEFSTPEPEVKAVAGKIAGWFKKQPEIKGVYFTKMKQRERVSYAFIIDCPEAVHKAVCERTVGFLKAEKVALPISLLKYKGLEKVVNESKHIEKVC